MADVRRDEGTGETVAIKVIDLEEYGAICGQGTDAAEDVRREIAAMSHCSRTNRNIVTYKGSVLRGSQLWVVMEYCGGGCVRTLLERVGPLDEDAVVHVAQGALLALQYLHRNGMIHRDLKAANLLLTEAGDVKLADFGVASCHANGSVGRRRESLSGSPYWMAPEVIKGEPVDERVDIWALGITIVEMLTGNPPLHWLHPLRALSVIEQSPPPRLDTALFSEGLCQLVSLCLHDDAGRRPTAEQLLKLAIFRRHSVTSLSLLAHMNCATKITDDKHVHTGVKTTKAHRLEPEKAKSTQDPESRRPSPLGSSSQATEAVIAGPPQSDSSSPTIGESLPMTPCIEDAFATMQMADQDAEESKVRAGGAQDALGKLSFHHKRCQAEDRELRRNIGVLDEIAPDDFGVCLKRTRRREDSLRLMVALRMAAVNVPSPSAPLDGDDTRREKIKSFITYIKETATLIDAWASQERPS